MSDMDTLSTEKLHGIVQKIIFSNQEKGFGIAVLKSGGNGAAREIVMTGPLARLVAGEEISAEGKWVIHPRYGRQYSVSSYMKILPQKAAAIEAYLASGMIKGVGPATAKSIVAKFGDKTLEILGDNPGRLVEVDGIGEKKMVTIAEGWKKQVAVQEIMMFLSAHDISPGYAAKIYKRYGLNAIQVLQTNPYQISYDIDGIGFIIADKIAEKMNFPKDSPGRVEAGTLYALDSAKKEGHVFCPAGELCRRAMEILKLDNQVPVWDALSMLIQCKRVIMEEHNGVRLIYPHYYFLCETESVKLLKKLERGQGLLGNVHGGQIDEAIRKAESKYSLRLTAEQREAVKTACYGRVSVITGGPGTGKTVICKIIVDVFRQRKARVQLAAPTGRASMRLQQSCDHDALTIHRLLEYSPAEGGFLRDEDNPLGCDLLIIDETSMVDLPLFYALLRAIPHGAHLCIIGDADQLPSVGPGLVMRNLVDAGVFPVTRLTRIFRQGEGSQIVHNAHLINKGVIPGESAFKDDCIFICAEQTENAVRTVIDLAKQIHGEGKEVQVISPMRKRDAGADRLNDLLQDALNPVPAGQEKTYVHIAGSRQFRVNDRIMNNVNDYEKSVFNGEVGFIESIDHENQSIDVIFDQGFVTYDFSELDNLSLAYAITCHKSQGSEFAVVINLLIPSHFIMLERKLLYTSITRSKQKVIIVGSKKALAIAVKNDKPRTRHSLLKERLLGMTPETKARCVL